MALNKQVFITRAISGLSFAAIMLAGLLWNQWSFLLLFSIIHFGCWREFLRLIEKIYQVSFHLYIKLGFMLMGFGLMLMFCGPQYVIANYGLKENACLPISLAGFLLLSAGIFQKRSLFNLKAFGMAALGWLYISFSWGTMVGIYEITGLATRRELMENFQHVNQHEYVLADGELLLSSGLFSVILIAAIWINDTMAYIVGSLIGKTPFSKISPKKTWEGTLGGAILAIGVVACAAHYLLNIYWIPAVIVPAIAAIFGTAGDLLESKLKRSAGVKDSGNMMPGHGGFMDRFDSLLLATPIVWLVLKLIM